MARLAGCRHVSLGLSVGSDESDRALTVRINRGRCPDKRPPAELDTTPADGIPFASHRGVEQSGSSSGS
jgi:hypothetical protein